MSKKKQIAGVLDVSAVKRDREFLQAMTGDLAGGKRTQSRAKLILTLEKTGDLRAAAKDVGVGIATARKCVTAFNQGGWKSLLTVQAPRGGDFLARYDQGFWAERLVRVFLDHSKNYRAIPYGTSRSEPFTDMESFRSHAEAEFLLQAWSGGGRWKRPDLLMIPREFLRRRKGNDAWTPDLQHLDNERCMPFVRVAVAAIEVETSLWQVKKATVPLSFTVKKEDLEALRKWVQQNRVPLFIAQVFYDQAYALPFATLEAVISLPKGDPRRVESERDRFTKKLTYKIGLGEGVLLGDIPEPDVEGKVFKSPNGRVTVYGRLVGSKIEIAGQAVLEQLASGTLKGNRN